MIRSWRVADFIVIWLAGLAVASLFSLVAAFLGDTDWTLILGLAGQYAGSLGTYFAMARSREKLNIEIELQDLKYVGLGVIFQIAMGVLFLPLTQLLFPEGRPPQIVAEMIAESDTMVLQLSLVLAALLFAPLTEEIMYRGVLLRSLERPERLESRMPLLVSAAVFSLVHLTGLDLERFWASAAVVLPPLFLLGLVLAWLVLRQKRVGPAIMFHLGWNLLAAVVLLIPAELLEQAAL